jgi:methionyl-tRNA formyltransferase
MKDKQDVRIVFMGTPEFAVNSLKALIDNNFNVVAVITAPDKEAGRGMKLTESAVKKYALTKKLNILQPEKLKSEIFLEELKKIKADLQIVVAFRMLPEVVWNMPPMGTINVHGSLLPHYRGAAPINWAIINGEKQTGVTTFKLKHEIDTGDILLQKSIPILEEMNAGDVHDALMHLGAETLVETVNSILNGSIQEIPQEKLMIGDNVKHAPKIFTETCFINWENIVNDIYNLIRGLSPYPAAFTMLDNKKIKIFSSEKEICEHQEVIGNYLTDSKTFLKFACKNGFIHCKEIQLEGKKKMLIEDFLRGYRF